VVPVPRRQKVTVSAVLVSQHWSKDPPWFHFEPSGLNCECPRLLFKRQLLLHFDFNADPDPASKNNANTFHNHTDSKGLVFCSFLVPWEKLCVCIVVSYITWQTREKLSMRGKVTKNTQEIEKKTNPVGSLCSTIHAKQRKM
jgi:hypothetical protein